MPIASEKITEFPKQADRPSPLAPIPAHLVTEERDPAREIRNLIEQLQESTLEARRHQRKAEEECDQMRRKLLDIENHAGPSHDDPQLKTLTHERDVLLQQAKAVRMNRSDEEAVEAVERCSAEPLLDAIDDPILEFRGGALRERERDDGFGRKVVGQKVHDALRHDLGLARARRGDDLHVAAAMADGVERGAR